MERRKNEEKPEPVKGTSCAQLPLRKPASPFYIQYHLSCFFNNTCIFRVSDVSVRDHKVPYRKYSCNRYRKRSTGLLSTIFAE